MNILLTGGAGFIGSHTADLLIEKGHKVRILDLLDPQVHGENANFPDYLHPDIEKIYGDVCQMQDVDKALKGIDAVYHFAALTGVGQSMYDMRNYVHTNCIGTVTLLESIVKKKIKLKHFILASSRAVYGEGTHSCSEHGTIYPSLRLREDLGKGVFHQLCPRCKKILLPVPTMEERPLNPLSVYAETKKHQEDYCRYVANTFGIPVTILRYFNVYGSRQSLKNPYTGVVSIFYNRIMANQALSLYEQGKPGRDFVHVNDVAKANVLALENNTDSPSTFNVGSGNNVTIKDVANALAKACHKRVEMLNLGEFRQGDIFSCFADLRQANQKLKYSPTVSLEQGMQEFVQWAVTQESFDGYEKTVNELEKYGLFGRTGKS